MKAIQNKKDLNERFLDISESIDREDYSNMISIISDFEKEFSKDLFHMNYDEISNVIDALDSEDIDLYLFVNYIDYGIKQGYSILNINYAEILLEKDDQYDYVEYMEMQNRYDCLEDDEE